MKLTTLKNKKPVQVAYEHDGETLNLTVDANLLTQEFVEKMESIVRDGQPKDDTGLTSALANLRFMSETLARAIVSWDLTDNDEPVPVSVEVFRQLPQSVIAGLFAAVMGAGSPKAETGQPFDGGSFQAVN
ncbi:MAG: hypothetical protein K1Y36_10310 [Blastocatellia bacterium]|nr:hypothetical protein [Blastocatellia bacterium]